MKSNKKTERLIGVLFLLIFVTGIVVYQILQGPVLFSDDYLTAISASSNKIIISILLLSLSGITSIIISTILFPIFKKQSITLALLYFAFSILGFIAIAVDNISVLSMLELSLEYAKNGTNNSDILKSLGNVFYKVHAFLINGGGMVETRNNLFVDTHTKPYGHIRNTKRVLADFYGRYKDRVTVDVIWEKAWCPTPQGNSSSTRFRILERITVSWL